jgi:hypothetical protein
MSKRALSTGLALAGAMMIGTAMLTPASAQNNTPNNPQMNNSGTAKPDEQDVNKQSTAPRASGVQKPGTVGATNTNSGTRTPDEQDVNRATSSPSAMQPRSTSGTGATNTNSGTKTPDEQDVNARRQPGSATSPTPSPTR